MSQTKSRSLTTKSNQKNIAASALSNKSLSKNTASPKKEQAQKANEALTRAWDLVAQRKDKGNA